MKHTIIITLALLQPLSCYGIMATGTTILNTITNNMTEHSPWNFVSDDQSYVTGGVTFTYPIGYFTLPPVVQISIEQNIAHPTTEAYVAEVVTNSSSATTVMVYKISAGVVSEAAINSVTVCLLAIAKPV